MSTPMRETGIADDRARAAGVGRATGPLGWLARCVAHESTPRDLRNLRRWLLWMLAWVVVAVPDASWFGHVDGRASWVTLLQAALVGVALVGVVGSFVRYVRETDELNRLVQLRALSVGFGAGFLTSELGQSAVDAGLVAGVDRDVPILAMIVAYAVTSVLVLRRYR